MPEPSERAGESVSEWVPPGPDCERYQRCPLRDDGSYHGACLWHDGRGTCTQQTPGHAHISRPVVSGVAAADDGTPIGPEETT
jgi:hypothetical protein